MRQSILVVLISSFFLSCSNPKNTYLAQKTLDKIDATVDSIYNKHPETLGLLVHLEMPDQNISYTKTIGYDNKQTKAPLNKKTASTNSK